jgi:serine/threonine protein kinase
MAPSNDPSRDSWAERERLLTAFEEAWRRGERPAIEAYLPATATCRSQLLTELIHIELERRLTAGEPARVEDYLERFSELRQDSAIVLDLIATELELRRERDPNLSVDGYASRFPDLALDLRSRHRHPSTLTTGDANPVIGFAPSDVSAGYQILKEVGRGATGVVYQARHCRLGRIVALKVLRAGVHAGPAERERFHSEAQAIARLQHPNIVQIFEVGEHEGLPFLALEFVDGGSLRDRLKGKSQPPRDAATLLETLARAIHYAHQHGVLHRDLKPANILLQKASGSQYSLVSSEHGEIASTDYWLVTTDYSPKITDFGLAKRLDASMGHTHTGDILGTPSYMAPEQAAGRLKDVGPAADVYALGAILYEVLTGRAPFQGDTGFETLRQVMEEEPLPPSRIQPRIPHDLQTICLKCLHKDPKRRYPSAIELAEDLCRFSTSQPIRARSVGLWEKGWKWTRRRPAWAALLAVSMVAIIGLMTGGMWHTLQIQQALDDARWAQAQADQERRKAETLQREAERAAEEARKNAATAQTTADFLASIFQTSEPLGLRMQGFRTADKKEADLTARQLLDRGAQRVRNEIKDAAVRAAMTDILGDVFRSLGEYDQAEKLLGEALRIRQQLFGKEHRDIATSLFHLAWLRQEMGEYAEAERLYREALALRVNLAGRDHLLTAEVMVNLAWLLAHQLPEPTASHERLAEAEKLLRDALRIRRERLESDHPDLAFTLLALGAVLFGREGADAESMALLTQAASILGKKDEKLGSTGSAIIALLRGEQARKEGRYDEALTLHNQALATTRRLLGNGHPFTGLLLGKVALLLRQTGDLVGAEKAIREALDIGRHSPARWHPVMIDPLNQLADHVQARGDLEEAEELYREALAIAEFRREKYPRLYQQTLAKLTALLRRQGRHPEADELLHASKSPGN